MFLQRSPGDPESTSSLKRVQCVSIHAPAGTFDRNSGLQADLVSGRHALTADPAPWVGIGGPCPPTVSAVPALG